MQNIIDLSGKKFLITGAGSGIGRATAILASQLGASLTLVDISEDGLNETMAMLQGTGHIKILWDLSEIDSLQEASVRILGSSGSLDGLVHCAGISSRRPIGMLKRDKFDKLMGINFYSFIELVRHLTKRGCFSDGGSIVVMSSISSIRGYKAKTEYCVSKAAVDAFVRCAALELADRRIRVNSVMPAEVLTPMAERAREINNSVCASNFNAPLGPSSPAEVANTIAFLLSDATRTLTGTSIRIDGGACI